MDVTQIIMVIAAFLLVYVLAKLNRAIKMLHSRVKILSHVLKNVSRQVDMRAGAEAQSFTEDIQVQDEKLCRYLERDFS